METLMESKKERKIDIHQVDPDQKIANKELVAYFLYGLGEILNYGMIGSFLTVFYTDRLFISASVIGTLVLIARVWDAVNDPIMAGIIDSTNSSKGKFRFWMRWVPIFIVLSTMWTVIPWNFTGVTLIAVVSVLYIAWGMIFTVSDVPFWSLSTVMSNDTQERSKAVTVANAGVTLGFALPGLIVPIVAKFIGGNIMGYPIAGNEAFLMGLPWAIMSISLLTYPMMWFGYKYTKERRNANLESVKVKDMLATVKSAKPLFRISIVFFLGLFAELATSILPYFCMCNLGNSDALVTISLYSMLAYAVMMMYPFMTKFFKKKQILITALGIDVVIRLVLYFFVGYSNVTLVIVGLALCNIVATGTSATIPNLIGENVEYCEYKTGKRTESIVFSFQTFTGKFKTAVALSTVGFALTFIGYNPSASAQSTTTLNWLFALCTIIPAIGNFIKILFCFRIKYTEPEYEMVVSYLKHKYAKSDAEKDGDKDTARFHNSKMEENDCQTKQLDI